MRKIMFVAVAVMLFAGVSYGADEAEFNATLKRAQNGDVEAQYEVGRMYSEGDGVAQDYRKAM
ncbi:MAG: hypothetical protein II877_03900, partial [Synergistaceae bacterium]|nr:hypothetical protein [Synergistaceae bacterium]